MSEKTYDYKCCANCKHLPEEGKCQVAGQMAIVKQAMTSYSTNEKMVCGNWEAKS